MAETAILVLSAFSTCTAPSGNLIFFLSSSDTTAATKRKPKTKTQRKWGDEAPTESDMASLDFSYDKAGDAGASQDPTALVDQSSLGTRTQDGLYEVKDWEFSTKGDGADDVISQALKSSQATSPASAPSSLGALGSLFARLTGSKVLPEADLKPVLECMKQHLMKKNVAKEIADKVCEGVGESLIGKKVGGFQSKCLSHEPITHYTYSSLSIPHSYKCRCATCTLE